MVMCVEPTIRAIISDGSTYFGLTNLQTKRIGENYIVKDTAVSKGIKAYILQRKVIQQKGPWAMYFVFARGVDISSMKIMPYIMKESFQGS